MQEHIIALSQRITRLLAALACFIVASLPAHAADHSEHGTKLRIRVGDRIVLGEEDLQRMTFRNDVVAQETFRRNVIPIKPGQSVQLKVEIVNPHGRATDVTNSGTVEFQSVSPWKLNVSQDGLVTLPNAGGSVPQLWADSVGDTAIHISLRQSAPDVWNKIFFSIAQ